MMTRYYADTDADCQSFHICAPDGSNSLLKYSFLCPNGTLFNQQYFICDWWFNVDCSQVQTSSFIFNNFSSVLSHSSVMLELVDCNSTKHLEILE